MKVDQPFIEQIEAAMVARDSVRLAQLVVPNMIEIVAALKASVRPEALHSTGDPDEGYDGWAEPGRVDELLREIIQMTDSAGIKRKVEEAREALKLLPSPLARREEPK